MRADIHTLHRIAARLRAATASDRIVRVRNDFAATLAALRSAPVEEVRRVC